MGGYLPRLFGFATTRSVARTDLLGGVFGVLVPSFFILTGRKVPEDAANLVALWASCTVLAVVALRLLAAPYYLWKSDQETISSLKAQLDDPARRRREAFEEGMQNTRAQFAHEMRSYLDDLDTASVIYNRREWVFGQLNNWALYFMSDGHFDNVWRHFKHHFDREASIVQLFRRDDIDEFMEIQINRNMNYYFQCRRAAARAVIKYLTYVEDYDSDMLKEISDAKKHYDALGIVDVFDEASLAEARARLSPSEPEA